MESSNDKPTGPSKAGKIVALLSVVVFSVVVITPVPATTPLWLEWLIGGMGVLAVFFYMFWSAPKVMKSEDLTFWVAEVDFFTGIAGLFWWIALAGILQSTYSWVEYILGLVMMTATAIIIGKMARYVLTPYMGCLGLLLGAWILGLNWIAIYCNGLLAIPSLNQLLSLNWAYGIYFMLLTGLVVAAISAEARYLCLYWEREGLQRENKDLAEKNRQLERSVEHHKLEASRFQKANEELHSAEAKRIAQEGDSKDWSELQLT